jgi:hypothetical protein
MILAVVGIVHSFDLLPYYVVPLLKVGVARFVIACNVNEGGELGGLLVGRPDVLVLALPRTFRRSNLVGMVDEEIRVRASGPHDWVIPAGLDELNQYLDDLQKLASEMEWCGYSRVVGELRHRLAPLEANSSRCCRSSAERRSGGSIHSRRQSPHGSQVVRSKRCCCRAATWAGLSATIGCGQRWPGTLP